MKNNETKIFVQTIPNAEATSNWTAFQIVLFADVTELMKGIFGDDIVEKAEHVFDQKIINQNKYPVSVDLLSLDKKQQFECLQNFLFTPMDAAEYAEQFKQKDFLKLGKQCEHIVLSFKNGKKVQISGDCYTKIENKK